MSATDIIAWAWNAAIYCEDCKPNPGCEDSDCRDSECCPQPCFYGEEVDCIQGCDTCFGELEGFNVLGNDDDDDDDDDTDLRERNE